MLHEGFNGVNLLEQPMNEGLERDGKEAFKGSFDPLEAFVFLWLIDKSKFSGRE